MRRLALMKTITMTSTTQITRVHVASPQAADRSLDVGARGLNAGVRDVFYAPMHKAPAVKDVAYLRCSRRPPV
jgi:2-keto-3-deoxy-L-rhamnonate aldolase RhmA